MSEGLNAKYMIIKEQVNRRGFDLKWWGEDLFYIEISFTAGPNPEYLRNNYRILELSTINNDNKLIHFADKLVDKFINELRKVLN